MNSGATDFVENFTPFEYFKCEACSTLWNAVKKIPPEIWKMSEPELRRLVNPKKAAQRLRFAVMGEFYLCLNGGRKITLQNLADRAGISYARAHNLTVGHPPTFAWILRPLAEAQLEGFTLKHEILDAMVDLVQTPHKDEHGNIDHRLIEAKVRLHEILSPVRKFDPPKPSES